MLCKSLFYLATLKVEFNFSLQLIEKKQYEELIKSRGFNIIIQNGSRLDRYKTVEFKSDKSKFRFIFYSMESYLRFEYCDIIQNICYIETYNEQAYESHIRDKKCIEFLSGDKSLYNACQDEKCAVSSKQNFLKMLDNEIENFDMSIAELKEIAYELAK